MYDLIIIGAGPAGLTASLYASRYKLNHLIFDQSPGGQGLVAGQIENFPGFEKISGPELMQRMREQVESYGVKIKLENVKELKKGEGVFKVTSETGEYQTKTLILAMGASFKNLDILGEKELIGKGVSSCTVCDAPFFKEKIVAVVGGGNSAVSGALHAASFASRVYLIHRRDEFRAEPFRVEQMRQNPKIEQLLSTQITQVKGKDKVEAVVLDKPYQGKTELVVDGVFIEVGQIPSSVLASELGVKMDEQGYIEVSPAMETSVPGVFAAGDLAAVREGKPLHQLVTAAADGARAATTAYQYLQVKLD